MTTPRYILAWVAALILLALAVALVFTWLVAGTHLQEMIRGPGY